MKTGPLYGGPGDFRDHIVEPVAPRAPATPTSATAPAALPLTRLQALCAADRRFAGSWERQRPDWPAGHDDSASAHDLALATLAAEAGWADAEVWALLDAGRRRHGEDPKRPDYFQRTIERARLPIPEREAAAAGAVADSAGRSREEQIERLAAALSVPVCTIIRRGARDANLVYVFVLTDGRRVTMPAAAVRKLSAVQEAFWVACDVAIHTMKSVVWIEYVQMIGRLAEDDPIPEAPQEVELWEWLRAYVDLERLQDTIESHHAAIEASLPFVRDGAIHINASALADHLFTRHHEKIATGDLRLRLRAAGFENIKISERIDNRMITRRYWRAPVERVES